MMKRQRRAINATQVWRWRFRRREDDEDTSDDIDQEMLVCIGDDEKQSPSTTGTDS
jgi:hypothetical protein